MLIATVLLACACANIRNITGGPEDRTPPVIDPKKSTPNHQTNFRPREIRLSFDEWINLNNPQQNIIFSPRLKKNPHFKLQGKTVIVELDKEEQLRDSTTYTIFFGKSIEDITQKNVAKKIYFVFSTGPVLDSLTLEGTVVDALSQQKSILTQVSLYDALEDSAFVTSPPVYITYTDSMGRFLFENLKQGTYRLYALIDKNQNFFFDQKTESMGFLEETVAVPYVRHELPVISLSQERTRNYVKDKKEAPGRIRLWFATAPQDLQVRCSACRDLIRVQEGDSVVCWYRAEEACALYAIYEGRTDTFNLKKAMPPKVNGIHPRRWSRQWISGQPWTLQYQEPLARIDTALLHFNPDVPYTWQIDTADPRNLRIVPERSPGDQFVLRLDSNAIVTIFGSVSAADTLQSQLVKPSSLSRVKFNIGGINRDEAYIFQILLNDKVQEERTFVSQDTGHIILFEALMPGNYKVRLIEDRNRNGIWDPGKFLQKMLPEKTWIWPIKEVRADWDLEIKLSTES